MVRRKDHRSERIFAIPFWRAYLLNNLVNNLVLDAQTYFIFMLRIRGPTHQNSGEVSVFRPFKIKVVLN